MANTASTTPFPLGAYLSNPDNSSASNEAIFDSKYSNFTKLFGAAPQFIDTYVDYTQPVSSWLGNTDWEAASFAASADAKGTIPVIGLPMASIAPGSMTADQQFQAFASGQYDSVLRGIVQAWAQQGFKALVFRPGWEMNLEGPTYAGDTAQSQADWVKAFQHVYTVLHQAATADGVSVQVVWNPGVTNYTNAEATTNLYPGDNYVDVIGADAYSDLHPFSDSSPTQTYHDFATGGEDTTIAQFVSNPANRESYWSNPAETAYASDGSGGHSQSLTSLIQFAEAHGKPFAVPETGAGNSNSGNDVADDAAFPQWLAQQLTAAQAAGEKIDYVNIWDSNGGGNYEFTEASDGKPQEAAAWAKYFGGSPVPVTTTPHTVTIGSGADTLALSMSEDAWQGDATFTVSVDGKQIGGTQTVSASHAAGSVETFNVMGNFAAGTHTATVNFLNDAYAGTAATDRNLYVNSASIDGTAIPKSTLTELSAGPQSFGFVAPGPSGVQAATTLTLHLAEDAWQGDAQYAVSVDGKVLVQDGTVTASNAQGQSQAVSLQDVLSAGSHDVAVSFLNDAWGGSATADRNFYIKGIDVNQAPVSGTAATLLHTETGHFTITVPSS